MLSRQLTALALVVASACSTGTPGAMRDPNGGRVTAAGAITPVSLERADSCDKLLDKLQEDVLPHVGDHGIDGLAGAGVDFFTRNSAQAGAAEPLAAAPALAYKSSSEDAAGGSGGAYSGTNVQEAGVDEPDSVKTDGKSIFAVSENRLVWVDVSQGPLRKVDTLTLPSHAGEMLLAGKRILVFSSGVFYAHRGPAIAMDYAGPASQGTKIFAVDTSTGKLVLESTLELEGSIVTARLVGGRARVVVSSSPTDLPITYPTDASQAARDVAKAKNVIAVRSTKIGDWLPGYTMKRGEATAASGTVAPCSRVHRPKKYAGVAMTTVMTIDPANPKPTGAATVVGHAETVYATASRLYVSHMRWEPVAAKPVAGSRVAPAMQRMEGSTHIHAFDISEPDAARYLASGALPGQVLNQFSFSDHEGVLRVATTVEDERGSESFVTTLRQRGTRLVQLGRVGNLGKGERIYAVRFLGTLGYVVTFRQVDPLYVIDLRDPEKPAVRGELKIPGYSAYLHPIGRGRLIGVGASATTEGRRTGMQVSLFDVNDPASPKQLSVATLENAYTDVEYQHHAFLWWAPAKLVVVPVQGPMDGAPDSLGGRAEAFRVGDDITRAGAIAHDRNTPIQRSLVVGDRIYTTSHLGITAAALDTLEKVATLTWR